MKFSAKQIAEFIHGTIEGDANVTVEDISKIEEGREKTLSFLANPKYTKYIYDTKSSIVIVNKDLKLERKVQATLIRVENAYASFAGLLTVVEQATRGKEKTGIDPLAYVDKSAKIGENVYIAPFVYIGENVQIGNNTKIYPQAYISENVKIGKNTVIASGVKVYHNCEIGDDCIIHAGTIVGSDGFGFAPNDGKDYTKVPQVGNVIIKDKVEIGANTTIDRATIGSTIINKGVKLDNLIQIAHNVELGENTVIAAQTGVSGSTKIGKDCMIGGQVGIVGHVKLADEVKIGAQSGVSSGIKEKGTIIFGSPAQPIRNYQRSAILFKQLPQLNGRIKELENKIAELTEIIEKIKG